MGSAHYLEDILNRMVDDAADDFTAQPI